MREEEMAVHHLGQPISIVQKRHPHERRHQTKPFAEGTPKGLSDNERSGRSKILSADDNEKRSSFMGNAFKLGTELVAAVAVGTIIGFILDSWFDTKPWLIIIFFFLGAVAGMLNVIRSAKRLQKED